MTDTENRIVTIVIKTIPIERITVLNPRLRDRKKFREIVDSIRKVGLKQPIKVSRTMGADGEAAYNLVYGQGRLEAFLALGQKEIPAIVTDLSEDDSLLMSLVENVARRQHRPVEMLRAIGTLHEQGYTDRQIAAKIGYSAEYVVKIRRLLAAGENRLLFAVETGRMPLNVAMAIAAAKDEDLQRVLTQAFENHDLTLRQVIAARRWVEHRPRHGRTRHRAKGARRRQSVSSAGVIHTLMRSAEQHKLLIKRADLAAGRLRFIVEALRVLLSDEHFLNLLRAENVQTLPAPLARLIQQPQGA
ncbi:MAG: ParB/RepB/Spo0J family partition protein [Defluviicoccus sp.]|nr:ParB/RepB/Spo0J family partition protein [Defluviicoccus sp.]